MRVLLLIAAAVSAVACVALPFGSGPSAGMRVSGVLLIPAEPSLRSACARAAATGGFEVPCPRLVIEHRAALGEGCPQEPLSPNRDCLEDSAAGNPNLPHIRDSFVYSQSDVVIDGALHLFVFGVKSDSRLLQNRAGCGGVEGTISKAPEVTGSAAVWIECSESVGGVNSGHVLLRWARGSVVYAVSLHGHNQVNRDVELAIAQNIEYVGP